MNRKISLILPNIRSCHNVGAMFRTGDAFGVEKLYLTGYTAEPPKPQIDKVSLGAETWVPWERAESLEACIQELKSCGVSVYALERTETSESVEVCEAPEHVALIVGNEVDGISDDILAMCDKVVHIPMYGRKMSLNVSVAAGIALYVLRHAK